MPIMVLAESAAPVQVDELCPYLVLRSLDGTDLLPLSVGAWTTLAQCQGLDLAPREVSRRLVTGMRGSRLSLIEDRERLVRLPLFVRPPDGRLSTLMADLHHADDLMEYRGNDYRLDDGTLELVAVDPNTGEERYLRCVYLEGMEGDYSDTVPLGMRMFGLSLLAVDPDWRGGEWTTDVLRIGSPVPFFTTSTEIMPWGGKVLTSSSVLGQPLPVRVGGDLPSAATIEVTGPATAVHVTSPATPRGPGMDVTVGPVDAGATLIVDASPRRKRLLLNGADAPVTILAAAPQWGRGMMPGSAEITVSMTGATAASGARVYGRDRWRRWLG